MQNNENKKDDGTTTVAYLYSVHDAICAVDKRRVTDGRYQSHRRVDRLIFGDQGGLHAVLERVLGQGKQGVVGPVSPVNDVFTERDGERLMVHATDQRVPGAVR